MGAQPAKEGGRRRQPAGLEVGREGGSSPVRLGTRNKKKISK